MAMKQHFELLAQYNQWMNKKLYDACATLDETTLQADSGAFFSSILGTLNHILVADILWLKRFTQHPANYRSLDSMHHLARPEALDQILYPDFNQLAAARDSMDQVIIQFCNEATEEDFEHCFSYQNSRGEPFSRHFGFLVLHVFNHQTHHRGQATTLLNQKGVDIGITDLPAITPTC